MTTRRSTASRLGLHSKAPCRNSSRRCIDTLSTWGGLRGGSSEMLGLFDANADIERLIHEWNERVGDHTGTWPVLLERRGDELEDIDSDDDDDVLRLSDGEPISVVSRWDLQVVDAVALIEAGREAHKRLQPRENDEDAAFAVPDAGRALYALLHEAGEPWHDMPGVEVVRGVRAYVRRHVPAGPLSPEDVGDETIVEPAGDRLYGESWA